MPGGGDFQVDFVIASPAEPKQLAEVAETIVERALIEGAVQIRCTPEAEEAYIAYFNKLQDYSNEADDDRTKSSNGKLQSYVMRFALIIEILRWAERYVYTDPWEGKDEFIFKTDETDVGKKAWEKAQERIQITTESMASAISICEYYRFTNYKEIGRASCRERVSSPV